MKRIVPVLTLIILISCELKESSTSFYEKCDDSQLNLEDGIEVTDSLGYFSFRIPDSSWKPERFLDQNDNGLTIGDTSLGYLRLFNVIQSDYTYDWNWAEEQKNIEKKFNVIETGEILLIGQERPYNLVLFENDIPKMISFYVTIIDTIINRHYTLNLMTEYSEDYKSRICKMKPLMESFKTKI